VSSDGKSDVGLRGLILHMRATQTLKSRGCGGGGVALGGFCASLHGEIRVYNALYI